MQPGVFGLVDHCHSAATELFYDAVVRNGLSDHVAGFFSRVRPCYGGHGRQSMRSALLKLRQILRSRPHKARPMHTIFIFSSLMECCLSAIQESLLTARLRVTAQERYNPSENGATAPKYMEPRCLIPDTSVRQRTVSLARRD